MEQPEFGVCCAFTWLVRLLAGCCCCYCCYLYCSGRLLLLLGTNGRLVAGKLVHFAYSELPLARVLKWIPRDADANDGKVRGREREREQDERPQQSNCSDLSGYSCLCAAPISRGKESWAHSERGERESGSGARLWSCQSN